MRKFEFEYLAKRLVMNFMLTEPVDAETFKKVYEAWWDDNHVPEVQVNPYFEHLTPFDLSELVFFISSLCTTYGDQLEKLREIESKKYKKFCSNHRNEIYREVYPALREAEREWVDKKLDA